jgi:hypothetical protein
LYRLVTPPDSVDEVHQRPLLDSEIYQLSGAVGQSVCGVATVFVNIKRLANPVAESEL